MNALNIREQFAILEQKDKTFSLLNEINVLKDQCIKENNKEYYYECILLTADVYIEHQNNDEAISLLLKEFKKIDEVIFQKVYLEFLDKLIYLYINKRNYKVALRYITLKEKYINEKDTISKNRFYLELAYVYGEMNDLDKALSYFNQILQNNPDNETKSYVLSNVTKIYIDKNEVKKAKESLNSCLAIETNHEGEVYSDYLLARIFSMEGKNNEAIQLYDNILGNEEINNMTLNIINDYLKLLNNLKKYDQSLLVMNKISLFINATDDLIIKDQFYHNKLDYFIGVNDTNQISNTMKEIDRIEKTINDNEEKINTENSEDDRNDIIEKTTNNLVYRFDVLTNLVNIALHGNTLREIIMDYSSKLQKIINFNELTFVLFNKINEADYQISDSIKCFKYKSGRLYEKNINYEALRDTVVEMMVTKNRDIAIDFSFSRLSFKDIFNGNEYNREEVKYINTIPCIYNNDTFAAVIYSSNENDLTEQTNTVILKLGTKLLESALAIEFANEKNNYLEKTINMVTNDNNIGLFYLNNNTMYLSPYLKKLFSYKHNTISCNEFIKNVAKADYDKYVSKFSEKEKYKVTFKYNLDDKVIQLEEIGEPIYDYNNHICYYQGIIKSLENESIGYALSQKDLDRAIIDLKSKSNTIEFKFSIIKIKGSVDEYVEIKKNFGVEPFYINDGSFIIILENEVNQRTLDRLIKNYATRSAIIRYPRDIINIDEMLSIASIMLDYNKLYFTDDIYRGYIKKNNLVNRIDSILNSDLILNGLEFNTFAGDYIYEIKPEIPGIDIKENINKYLGTALKQKYDDKLVSSIINNNFKHDCFVSVSNEYLLHILNAFDLKRFNNFTFVVCEYDKNINEIFDKLKEKNLKVYVDIKIINLLDAFYFTTGIIKGIFISEKINSNDLHKVLRLANMFELELISYEKINDYKKVTLYSGNFKKIPF